MTSKQAGEEPGFFHCSHNLTVTIACLGMSLRPARHCSRPSANGFASGECRAGAGEAGGVKRSNLIRSEIATPYGLAMTQ